MPPKQKEALEQRAIKLKVRPVIVKHANLAKEHHGNDWLERTDVVFECVLHRDEIDQFFKTSDDVPIGELLWNDRGEPQLVELDGAFSLKLQAAGLAKIGYAKGTAQEFHTARLKKISLEPMLDFKATMHAQMRVDPEGHAAMLSKINAERAAKLGFDGVVDEKPEAGDADAQEELPV